MVAVVGRHHLDGCGTGCRLQDHPAQLAPWASSVSSTSDQGRQGSPCATAVARKGCLVQLVETQRSTKRRSERRMMAALATTSRGAPLSLVISWWRHPAAFWPEPPRRHWLASAFLPHANVAWKAAGRSDRPDGLVDQGARAEPIRWRAAIVLPASLRLGRVVLGALPRK